MDKKINSSFIKIPCIPYIITGTGHMCVSLRLSCVYGMPISTYQTSEVYGHGSTTFPRVMYQSGCGRSVYPCAYRALNYL